MPGNRTSHETQSSRQLSKLNFCNSRYRFRYWALYMYWIQTTLFICKVILNCIFMHRCFYRLVCLSLIWTTFNSDCWSSWRWKHFFRNLEPSFLSSLFPQKKIRQFNVEFIDANVADQSNAVCSVLDALSPWFKLYAIPKTTTVGR